MMFPAATSFLQAPLLSRRTDGRRFTGSSAAARHEGGGSLVRVGAAASVARTRREDQEDAIRGCRSSFWLERG